MALAHHGLEDAPVEAPFITPPASRRRMTLKARWGQKKDGGRLLLGFNIRASHDLVDLEECPVSRGELVALFEPLRALLGEIMPTRGQCTVNLTLTRGGVAMLLGWHDEPDLALRERLAEFAREESLAALWLDIEGDLEPIAEPARPVIAVAGLGIPLPPGAFVQATAEGEGALLTRALEAMAGADPVADLFAGIGTFSLPLARAARVHAVEGEKRLLDALASAAGDAAAGLKPVTTEHRDLFRRPLTPEDLNRFGAVLFDPPRAGAKAQAAEIARSKVPLVVAVSCNPNTFARDARLLVDGGYRIESILPVDQFLWSPHVELVAVFRK
jgi:23S rRNA (uracil1939-C5)-methyltransferase